MCNREKKKKGKASPDNLQSVLDQVKIDFTTAETNYTMINNKRNISQYKSYFSCLDVSHQQAADFFFFIMR